MSAVNNGLVRRANCQKPVPSASKLDADGILRSRRTKTSEAEFLEFVMCPGIQPAADPA